MTEILSGAGTPFSSYSYVKTPPNVYLHVQNYPRPLHVSHIPLRGRKPQIDLLSKGRPARWSRGSNPWVGRKDIAGQGNPTRDMTCISRMIRSLAGRVGPGLVGSEGVKNLTGQVDSGREL